MDRLTDRRTLPNALSSSLAKALQSVDNNRSFEMVLVRDKITYHRDADRLNQH